MVAVGRFGKTDSPQTKGAASGFASPRPARRFRGGASAVVDVKNNRMSDQPAKKAAMRNRKGRAAWNSLNNIVKESRRISLERRQWQRTF
jgi:hypothetical protein